MGKNDKNHGKITSKAYICRQIGSKYQHHKTIVPKAVIQQHQVGERATLVWIPYGNEYIVRVEKE